MTSKGVTFDNNHGDITIINSGQEQRRATIIGKLIEIIASQQGAEIDLHRIPAEIHNKISFNVNGGSSYSGASNNEATSNLATF